MSGRLAAWLNSLGEAPLAAGRVDCRRAPKMTTPMRRCVIFSTAPVWILPRWREREAKIGSRLLRFTPGRFLKLPVAPAESGPIRSWPSIVLLYCFRRPMPPATRPRRLSILSKWLERNITHDTPP